MTDSRSAADPMSRSAADIDLDITVPSAAERIAGRLADRVAADLGSSGTGRLVIGLIGPPGAGKSTAARLVIDALTEAGVRSALVPMDGFHLSQRELERLGRADRKGAPDTFDAAGYQAMLGRLRARTDETVYAPTFDRALEEPIAGGIAVPPEDQVIITEGNYLLLDQDGWAGTADLLDRRWYLTVPDRLRRERLIARHRRFGRTTEAATAWVDAVDEPNARLIAATAARADEVVDWC